MNKKNNILFSIVLCTYNREKHIERCLESLVNLDYPKNKFEIIVVDDGSTDATIEIVKKYPVTLIRHKKNRGVAAARNTGLKNAKGKIYICFDDDCFAHKNWLKNLEKAYNKIGINKTLGIAGFIQLKNNRTMIDKYMDEIGYANPSPVIYGISKNPIIRFYAYLKNMFFPIIQGKEKILIVNEIWGANCSFPIEILKKVNGWNNKMSGVEDTELCNRINKKIKNKKLFCTKSAIIYHDHQLSLQGFIKKPYSRGKVTLKFYQQNNKIPPIYPFPPAIILISLIITIINPLYGLLSLLILPQLFYAWWGIKAIKRMQLYFLSFPYLQGGYELSTVLGLMKGFI
ncbi:MAG TPA: glycosyltransferase family 2 protein [Candidatus Sulfotelmatobacter sp.]|jgi:glycosyltransferase involved in cell wall biosynthesis|nr:glycosyltransferase family 2 protein [Candidatus Sulfotelmatobacter sp.]